MSEKRTSLSYESPARSNDTLRPSMLSFVLSILRATLIGGLGTLGMITICMELFDRLLGHESRMEWIWIVIFSFVSVALFAYGALTGVEAIKAMRGVPPTGALWERSVRALRRLQKVGTVCRRCGRRVGSADVCPH